MLAYLEEGTLAAQLRFDLNHGHMVLFQTGHTPNDVASDDRDVSSAHQGLAQFLMCDGSVRPIEESIDFGVYTALGTRAGDD